MCVSICVCACVRMCACAVEGRLEVSRSTFSMDTAFYMF
jgi:hypothetical protein